MKSKKIDVLIIDESGSSYIKHCIPDKASFSVLPVRGTIPLVLSLIFFKRFTSLFLNSRKFKESFLFSIVDALDPKILITFIDNSDIISKIHKKFPNKTAISVQNGFRSGPDYKAGFFNKEPVSIYFGFGDYEGGILKKYDIKHRDYFAVGSLKYSLFVNKKFKNFNNKFDFCFISQFNISDDPFIKILMRDSKLIFMNLLKICKKYDFSICVAMRYEINSPYYESELNFYKNIDLYNDSKLISNNNFEFQGYKTASNSEVLISICSTLAFEMFGAGHKVLFGASSNSFELAKFWDSYGNFAQFPNLNLLDFNEEDSIYYKLTSLLNIETSEYFALTANARKHYMNFSDQDLTHKMIYKKIKKILEN